MVRPGHAPAGVVVSWQVIRQEPGTYLVFSTETDTVVAWDMTADDIRQMFIARDVDRTLKEVTRVLGAVDADEPRRAYFQFTMTLHDATVSDRAHGGEFSE
jgi:hypothetical protein